MPMRRVILVLGLALAVTAVAAATASAKIRLFQSPTGNIGCVIAVGNGGNEARCDVAQHSWQAGPKPKNCELDYGQGLVVGTKHRAAFVCAGDTTLHQGPVLRYGRTVRRGTMSCTSSTSGMTCRNGRGHGFFLSKQRYRLF